MKVRRETGAGANPRASESPERIPTSQLAMSGAWSRGEILGQPSEGGRAPFADVLESAMPVVGVDPGPATGGRSVLQHEVDVADRREMIELAVDHQDGLGDPVAQPKFRERPPLEDRLLFLPGPGREGGRTIGGTELPCRTLIAGGDKVVHLVRGHAVAEGVAGTGHHGPDLLWCRSRQLEHG